MNGFPSQSDTAIVRWGVSEELVPADIYQALATAGGLRKGRTDAFERPPVPSVADSIIEQMLPHLPPIIADTDLLTGDGTITYRRWNYKKEAQENVRFPGLFEVEMRGLEPLTLGLQKSIGFSAKMLSNAVNTIIIGT
ncbi:hypothetical protein ACFL2H_08940 [Planctomycetota bacterium]